jgi:multicomponent Na+:H+ antiporter subunit G
VKEAVTAALLILGAVFSLLAAVGLLRFPDLFTRLQTTAKPATLGVVCMILAAAVHFADLEITVLAVLIAAFFFLTSPVAAHVIARAAYSIGVPLWEKSVMDDLRNRRGPREEEAGAPPDVET